MMGLIEIASGNSIWRGANYYESGMVLSSRAVDETHYEGTVKGSGHATYTVTLDLEHPKKSTCTCAHAEGVRRVCKHKTALYFSLFPDQLARLYKEVEQYEKQEEQRLQDRRREIERYVNSLSKQQLREQLLWRLIDEEENAHRW